MNDDDWNVYRAIVSIIAHAICNYVGDLSKNNWYTDCVSLGVSVYSILGAVRKKQTANVFIYYLPSFTHLVEYLEEGLCWIRIR